MERKERFQPFAELKTLTLIEVDALGLKLQTELDRLKKENNDVLRQRDIEEQLLEIDIAVAYLQHPKPSPKELAHELASVRGQLYRLQEWCIGMQNEFILRVRQAKAKKINFREDRDNYRHWYKRAELMESLTTQLKSMEFELKISEDMELSDE